MAFPLRKFSGVAAAAHYFPTDCNRFSSWVTVDKHYQYRYWILTRSNWFKIGDTEFLVDRDELIAAEIQNEGRGWELWANHSQDSNVLCFRRPLKCLLEEEEEEERWRKRPEQETKEEATPKLRPLPPLTDDIFHNYDDENVMPQVEKKPLLRVIGDDEEESVPTID